MANKAGILIGGGIVGLALAGLTRKAMAADYRNVKEARLPPAKSHPEDNETLARVIASEAGGEPVNIQTAVAYATMNAARKKGTSVTALVKFPDGKYGSQNRYIVVQRKNPKTGKMEPKKVGAYCASGKPALPQHRSLAAKVIARTVPDVTRGAVQYDSPQAQRKLLAKKVKGYRLTPEEVAVKRRKAGRSLVLLPGVSEERFRMWA